MMLSLTWPLRPPCQAQRPKSRRNKVAMTMPLPHCTASGSRKIEDASQVYLHEECSVENWRYPLRCEGSPNEKVVVALGKFDAMHLGHRALAVRAALQLGGTPCLLSFSGMAEVLGWPKRLPLVAACDRPRVLKSWEGACGDRAPRQRTIPFREIRTMSPEQFVRVLAVDLGAAAVVAGSNYRFGFKASGDAAALYSLGRQYGMGVSIVELVQHGESVMSIDSTDSIDGLDSSDEMYVRGGAAGGDVREAAAGEAAREGGVQRDAAAPDPTEVGAERGSTTAPAMAPAATASPPTSSHQISSSEVRELLARGEVATVTRLLGRCYRLVAGIEYGPGQGQGAGRHHRGSGAEQEQQQQAGSSRSTSSSSGRGGQGAERDGGGDDLVLIPMDKLFNIAPAHGLYEASMAVVYRGSTSSTGCVTDGEAAASAGGTGCAGAGDDGDGGRAGGAGVGSRGLLQSLPLDLVSGSGRPLRVQVEEEGLCLPRAELDRAVAAVQPPGATVSGVGGAAEEQQTLHFFVTVDFLDKCEED